MASITKPTNPVIDYDNSITSGLVMDIEFYEGSGFPKDLVTGTSCTFNGSPQWQIGPYGPEMTMVSAGSSNGVLLSLSSAQHNLTKISIEQTIYVPAGLIHWYNPWSLGDQNIGGAGARLYIEVNGNPGVTLGFVVNTDSVPAGGGFSIPIPPTGMYHHMVQTYDLTTLSTQPFWYLDGVSQSVTTATTPTGNVLTDSNIFTVGNGNDPTAVAGWPSPIVYTRMWNRILSSTEVAQLYQNPWRIFTHENIGNYPRYIKVGSGMSRSEGAT